MRLPTLFSKTLFSKECTRTVSLLCLLLISAVAVIYVSHLNRHTFSQYQMTLNERDRLDIEWGQLLLELSAQSQQARVERTAREKLAMKTPAANKIILVQW